MTRPSPARAGTLAGAAVPTEPAPRPVWWTLLVHLRLPFQLLLAPIFLWGWLLAGGGAAPRVFVAFVAFHVFLYGGATAYNSYYDRDEGPVGGLERPPPVHEALLPFALGAKVIGAALALAVGPLFLGIYLLFAALSVAYSHPAIRFKALPIGSLLVVGFGQGVLAFTGAFVAAHGGADSRLLAPESLVGALAATLVVLGLYPLTQLYQIEEDRARGDRTLPVAWGAWPSFLFALGCQAAGGALLAGVLLGRYGPGDALLVAAGVLVQIVALSRWAVHFDAAQVLANYRRVSRINLASAVALGGYFVYHLTR